MQDPLETVGGAGQTNYNSTADLEAKQEGMLMVRAADKKVCGPSCTGRRGWLMVVLLILAAISLGFAHGIHSRGVQKEQEAITNSFVPIAGGTRMQVVAKEHIYPNIDPNKQAGKPAKTQRVRS
eukprot:g2262.t1